MAFIRTHRLCFLGVALCMITVAAETFIPANDPSINYYGRFDKSNPARPRFNWSGSIIEAAFTGQSIGFELRDGTCLYDVELDGVIDTVITTTSNSHYTIATDLTPGTHVIRLVKRNEQYRTVAEFGGFYLADNARLMPLSRPQRRIEFIGDSYTAGYGTEHDGRDGCVWSARDSTGVVGTTNTNTAWARILSRTFHAQDIILAETAIGMVRSQENKPSFPTRYGQTLNGGAEDWAFASWIPSLVCIFLGTNDFFAGASSAAFISGYHAFLETVRGHYPDVPVLCICYPGFFDSQVHQVVVEETTSMNHRGIYYAASPTLSLNACHSHPTVADQERLAQSLVPAVRNATGWDTTWSTQRINPFHSRPLRKSSFAVDRTSNRVVIKCTGHEGYRTMTIVDSKGEVVQVAGFDETGSFVWDTSHVPHGMYFIGGTASSSFRIVVNH